MKKVFVSLPYSSSDSAIIEHRVNIAQSYCAELLKQNITPICPVISGHQYIRDIPDFALPYETWLEYALVQLDQTIAELHILMLDGYDESNGIDTEVKQAEQLNIPIYHKEI